MEQTEEQIVTAALALPPDSRTRIAERLIESVDPIDQAEIDAAWAVEIRRRLKEIDEGRVELIPAEDVFRSIEARLNR